MKVARALIPIFLLAMFNNAPAFGGIIPSAQVISWLPGVTVGVRTTIPVRTNLIDVTQAPYNVDNTGASDATAGINSAISAAPSNAVIYLPPGLYNVTSGINILVNDITLRGAGSNTVLVGNIKLGRDASGQNSFTITNGAYKGSTNFSFSAMADQWSDPVSVGDAFMVSSLINGSEQFPYISVFYYTRMLKQAVVVTGITGNSLTFSPPLVWDFTNSPTAQCVNLNHVLPLNKGIGIENLMLTTTNGGLNCTPPFMCLMTCLHDSWVQNCWFYNAENYSVYLTSCVNVEFSHNRVRFAKSSGSNHSGLLADSDSGCLIQDNIFSDGLQPGIEFNTGFCGNALFGNFFSNNISFDVDCHNTHPVMNLFEANTFNAGFEMDGYFGSASHQMLFRNNFASPYIPVAFKRWTTYMNVVGNVLGTSASAYTNFSDDIPNIGWQILELGRPNIGNSSFTGTNPPIPWNYPGTQISDGVPNGIFVFTNNQVNTSNLIGNFTNIPAPNGGNGVVIFQDKLNTNTYWPNDGNPVVQLAAGTSSNLLVNHAITVSNGWRVFYSWQNPDDYQQLQTSNKATDLITGNYDYYNKAVTWDTNGVQTIPVSLLYTNGAPSWWGTNHWPAIDPTTATLATMIPAQERYFGIPVGSRPTPPSKLRISP